MRVWDVLARRRGGDDWEVVGGVKAPDVDVALLLARESLFRRADGETYAVRLRGEHEVHELPDPTGVGGVIDREFRRMDSFAGVGGKLKRVQEEMARRGLVIDRPRPPDRRQRRARKKQQKEAADA